LIIANEQTRKFGIQHVEIVCLLPSARNRSLIEVVKRAPSDRNGARRIWMTMVAEPRLATGECMNWYKRSGKPAQHWGRYLRLIDVRSARPMKDDLHLLNGQSVI
jgi:hypothetical protein